MIPYILIGVAGLTVCGWLVLRHAVRTAGEAPSDAGSGLPAPRRKPAADRWQDSIRVDTRTDYAPDREALKRMEEKLRQEELRQKPWEGRN
jgi:hypothetical protein